MSSPRKKTEDNIDDGRYRRDAVTGLALTHDDTTVYSVGKEGGICRLDIATGTK